MNELYQSLVAVNPATLIVTICNLFIQMYVVKKFFLSKVLAILDQRRAAADQEISEAKAARAEALDIKKTYEENMKKAREEASEIVSHAQKTAEKRADEIIGQAKTQAAQIKDSNPIRSVFSTHLSKAYRPIPRQLMWLRTERTVL